MPNYYIWTIGCQMNKAESERLGSLFEQQGYRAVTDAEQADIIVLNSCVVRQSAENRVINKLHTLKSLKKLRPDLTLAVTGCLVNSDSQHLEKHYPHIDYFFKPGDCPPWLERTGQKPTLPSQPTTSAYIPIQQGCNNFCSYCIVPYRRGRERSRPIAEVKAEVTELVYRGVRQVVLLGQNVDSYGHDFADTTELADLLEELNNIDGLARIRFLTNHPRDMGSRLIDTIASLDKVCEQICLPVQSGDDDILQAMRRGYTAEQYRQLISGIRRRIPKVALSTDVIVGFPSERAEQFQQTFDLLSELKFDTIHVAAYSPRAETAAARELDDNVPLAEKKGRLNAIEQLQEGIAGAINARLLDQTAEVLVEGTQKNRWYGRTRGDKLVFFDSDIDCRGQLVTIRIEKTSPWSLQGKLEVNSADRDKEEK